MSIRIPDPQPEPTVSGTMRTVQLPDEAEARRLIEVQEAGGVETFAAVELERVEGHNGLLSPGLGPSTARSGCRGRSTTWNLSAGRRCG